MLNAIKELKNHNIKIIREISYFKKGNLTEIKGDTLIYKNIPEGLFLLMHPNINKIETKLKQYTSMIDLSRGAVFKVSYIKELIYKKALMGINELWLYMEDTFDLPKYPNFGYLRGKYSKEELKEIIKYAKLFEIEVIPTVQALGHHEQFLKWSNENEIKDQPSVLLIGEEKTYEFIEYMFSWLYDVFDTKTIHLGLDETWGMGFGNFYRKNGYHNRIEIFNKHLKRVVEIALKVGFDKQLMWSDMYFRIFSKTNKYYDLDVVIDKEITDQIPKSVTLVYWDYYNDDKKLVKSMLDTHIKTGLDVVFASGTWIWEKFTYDKTKTDETAKMHLKETLNYGLKNFILTQWLDDGAYGNHKTILLGVYEISCELYGISVNEETYELITGVNYQKAVANTKINNLKLDIVGLLWDDPLLHIWVNNVIQNKDELFIKHINQYKEVSTELKLVDNKSMEYLLSISGYYKLLARYNVITKYQQKNKIDKAIKYYKQYIKNIEKLIKVYRDMWYTNYKYNGFEIIESRLATQIYRAKEMIYLIKQYNKGKITKIDPLDEKISVNDYIHIEYRGIFSSTILS